LETATAILLRKTKLTETSLIVTWFSAEEGKLKTVAKGARQLRSAFAGTLDLFFDCEIQYVRSRKSELHALREVSVRAAHLGIRAEYDRVALGAYFVELVDEVTELEHPVVEIYGLLVRALGFLDRESASLRALQYFEGELARILGIGGQAEVSPAVAIGRAYQRLPKSRAGLVKRLRINGKG
jgi:DNA repair protein RecO (recombination protein O)